MGDPAFIPFNRPYYGPNAAAYAAKAMASGCTAGDGPFARQCEALLSPLCGGGRVMLTPSCTTALEMAGLLLGIGPDDEVIVPTFTFTSTANAFVLLGAKPVFIDSRPDTLNLDEGLLAAAITPRTKAIVVVHYAGVACDMDAIMALARHHGIPVIEDNAHGLLGMWRGRPLGSFGALATLSFHETKNLSCGEGGALVINDPTLIERAEILREKGTNRSQFHRGHVDKYSWVDKGSSYLPSEFQAAVLLDQVERHAEIQRRRQAIWEIYASDLATWAHTAGFKLPTLSSGTRHPAHLFHMLAPDAAGAEQLMRHLKQWQILAVSHYVPLHSSSMGRRVNPSGTPCPIAENTAPRLLRLPIFFTLSTADQSRVIAAIHAYCP